MHPLIQIQTLILAVWIITCKSYNRKVFQSKLPDLYQDQEVRALYQINSCPGGSGLPGVKENIFSPLRCPKNIINFLAGCSAEGHEYCTIGCAMSAISTYWFTEEKPIRQHPDFPFLITVIFTNRPPKPRYFFAWNVEIILDFVKAKWG